MAVVLRAEAREARARVGDDVSGVWQSKAAECLAEDRRCSVATECLADERRCSDATESRADE